MNRQIFGILTIAVMTQCSPNVISNKTNFSSEEILKPEIFGEGIISTKTESVFDIAFSPNCKTAYFTMRKENEKHKIMETNFKNGSWTKPKLCSFSTDRDETAFLTSTGNTLYFGSQRQIPNKPNQGNFDMNIWKVEKTKNG